MRSNRSEAPRIGRGRRLAWLLACGWLVLGAAGSAMADDAQQARTHLERRHREVRRLLSRPPGEARDERLMGILRELLDVRALGRRALGSAWEERSEAERSRFVEVLGKLVERSYRKGLERTLDYRVRTLGAEPRDGGVLVRTEARSRRNRRAAPVAVDYLLKRDAQGRWRVVDIVTDGVSLTDNYRRQFRRILRRDGWEALMKKLEARLREDDA